MGILGETAMSFNTNDLAASRPSSTSFSFFTRGYDYPKSKCK
jgi:hypothetical protein